ncbi:MAG: type II/IV secretion system protein, partial [Ignavibacteria bacterium]|nr:type II/IV secretion system protein [Ignavibacteria bacterium]
MTDKIGYLLLKKGIINVDILEKALRVKQSDDGKVKRNLAQILVQDFNMDHDTIFRQVAILYAFRELNVKVEEIPETRIDDMKRMINSVPEELKRQMLEHSVIPFHYDEKIRDKMILAAIDPTDRSITKIAYA